MAEALENRDKALEMQKDKLDEESGQASEAVFKQPNGVFAAKRM